MMKTALKLLTLTFVASIGLLLGSQHAQASIPAGCPGGPAGPPAPGTVCPSPGASSSGATGPGVNSTVAGNCNDIKNPSSGPGSIISSNGFLSTLCTGGDSQTAIQSVVENLTNFVLFIGVIVFAIMIGLGMVQVTTGGASPEALKAGKKRIMLAVSSIALFFTGRIVLDAIGVTGANRFLGVDLNNFTQNTVYDIIRAIWTYIQFAGGVLAVVMIVVGGIKLMTSAGNPQAVQSARKTITYAVIGLVGLLSATLIVTLIGEIIN